HKRSYSGWPAPPEPGEIITTKLGRSFDSLPSPYASHAPMLGRPAICDPVCRNVTAGSWLIASVFMELMKVRSSAIFAVCGSSSLTQAPEWPRFSNENFDGTTGKLDCVADIPVSRWPLRIESGKSLPWKSLSRGL